MRFANKSSRASWQLIWLLLLLSLDADFLNDGSKLVDIKYEAHIALRKSAASTTP